MKILSKEEEQAHYNATLKGGIKGGFAGLAVGFAGVYAATARYPAFRQLTLPLKAFLVSSAGTFAAIIAADKSSRTFEAARHSEGGYQDSSARAIAEAASNKPFRERAFNWARENRYPIVGASWVASMGIALAIVGRSPHLSTSQKVVQARVYAQGLTLAVLLATAAFEIGDQQQGEGRWETVKVLDPDDPTHKHLIEKRVHHESYKGEDMWRDMVEAEERKMKEREAAAREQEERDARAGKFKPKRHDHHHHHHEGSKGSKKKSKGDQDVGEKAESTGKGKDAGK